MTSSTSSSRPPSLPAAVLAVVLPGVLVAGVLAWWGRPDPAAGEGAAVAPEVAACLAGVEKADDEVVIVGNSKSGTDIDRVALARALGTGPIAKVGGPGSAAPLWYASLERCVFSAGHKPKLVVVYGTPGGMLRTTLESDAERNALAVYLGEHEPVLDQKVFGGDPVDPFWQRVRERKVLLLQGIQHGVRDGVAGLFFAPPGPEGLLPAGRAYAVPALEKVLGADAGAEAVTRHRAIPIAESDPASRAKKVTRVEDTLVPDFVALAHANGARIVFANAPLAVTKVGVYERVDPELVRAMVAALNELGAGYLDLTDLQLSPTAFGDGIHMNIAGRTKLTATLAERLKAMDALGASPFSDAALPRTPAVATRTGALPTLPALPAPKRGTDACDWSVKLAGLDGVSDTFLGRAGVGPVSPVILLEDGKPLEAHGPRARFAESCGGAFSHQAGGIKFAPTGGPAEVAAGRTYTVGLASDLPIRDAQGRELAWVFPGTSLRLDVPPDGAGVGFGVSVGAHVGIPGTSPATLSWGGASTPIVADGSVGTATLGGAPPAGAWVVEVASPVDGPWLLVERVVAGSAADPWYLFGSPDPGRRVEVLKGEATWAGDPPAIGRIGEIKPGKDGGFNIDTSALGAPDAESTNRLAGISGCSPVLLLEDGKPLPSPNSPLRAVKEGGGAYAHTKFGILFTPPDGSSPLTNGRTYTARLNPDRACRWGRWLYPGDVARFTIHEKSLRALSTGASRLELTGGALEGGDPDGVLRVRLFVGEELRFEATTPLGSLGTSPPGWALPTAVPADADAVSVELSTEAGAPFVMVTALTLIEPPRPVFEPAAPPP